MQLGILQEKQNPSNQVRFYWEEVTDSHDTGFAEENVLGRSEPFQFFANGSAMELSLPISLVAGETPGSSESNNPQSRTSIIESMNLIRAWTYPVASGGLILTPPVLIIILGAYQAQEVVLKGYSLEVHSPFNDESEPTILKTSINLIRVGLKNGPNGVGRAAPTYGQVKRGTK